MVNLLEYPLADSGVMLCGTVDNLILPTSSYTLLLIDL